MEKNGNKKYHIPHSYFILFVIFGVCIFIAGNRYYKNFEKHFRTTVENQLHLISDLKISELEYWLQERRGDAETIFGNEVFARDVRHYFKNPNDSNAKKDIQIWMKEFKVGFKYHAVFLCDSMQNRRISIGDESELPQSNISKVNIDSLRSGALVFADFYFGQFKQKVFLKVLIPILDYKKLIGIIELRIDPEDYLFSILSQWPLPSETFETFLVRKQDNYVVYLNELRFKKNSALKFRVPLENKNELVVRALRGEEGIIEGTGYRGTNVIAYVKKVPNSPWHLISQMDKSEVFAPLKEKFMETVVFFFSLFLIAIMGLLFLVRHQRSQYFKQNIKAAEALRESEERFRILFDKAPLSYQSLDTNGNFIDVNQTWLETFGYERGEIIGKWFGDFLTPENVDAFKQRFPIFKEAGNLQTNFELVQKNGTRRFISFEGRVAKDVDGNFIQTHGILQDITQQKKTELEQQVFYKITQSSVSTSNLSESLKLIHQLLKTIIYADNLFVALYDQNTKLFSFPYWADELDPIPEPDAMRKSLSSYVFRTGKTMLFSEDLFQLLREQGEVELVGSPSPSWIGIPLQTPDGIIGVLVLQHYEMENVYSEGDIKFLDTIGSQIALIIERKLAEEALRNEQLLLRTVIDNIPDSIYCKDTATRKILSNPTDLGHMGVKTEAEVLGKTDFDFFPKELAEGFFAADQLVLKEGKSVINREEFVFDESGQKRWLLTSKLPLKDKSGNIIGIVGIGRDVTSRKQAEQALRESEIKLNVILESTADGILAVDSKGKVIKTNRRFAELWQIPQSLINSGDDDALISFVLSQLTDPDAFISKVHKLYNTDFDDLDLLYFSDGRIFERFSAPLAMIDSSLGRVWSFRDITERKRSEVALRESEEQFRSVLETISLIGVMLDTEGRITLCNDYLLDLTGWKREEVLNKNWFDLFIPPEIQTHIQMEVFKTSIEGGVIAEHFDNEIITRGGERRLIAWNNTTLRDHLGVISGVASIGEDISERKKVQEQIRLKNLELQKTNAEKDKFFSIIAHDLRSPFNGFLGLTQIMAEELSDLTMDEIQDMAVTMRNSASNLFQLLENLLEWARMQQGLIHFKLEELKLKTIVDESVLMVLDSAKNKGIIIDNDIDNRLTVFADSNILQTVIRNLVSNSVKFTHKGGKISISASAADIHFIEVAICDNGIGMNSKMVEQLFQLNLNTNRKGTEGEPSSGLGLLLCKEFIEKHGGKLWVESQEGIGSVFYFTIPVSE